MSLPIRSAYGLWPQYNRRLRAAVAGLTDEQLGWRVSPDHWPVWALVAHLCGTRVYWLCHVIGLPGAETTPFTDAANVGWEDDLDHPRGVAELLEGVDASWQLVEGCLDTWTLDMLADEFGRIGPTGPQVHSRASILQRMLSHDAYHTGEVSQILGSHGLPAIDLWRPD